MRPRTLIITVFALFAAALAAPRAAAAQGIPVAIETQPATPTAAAAQPDDLRAMGGEWIYIEDLTEGRTLEELGPPMASKMWMRVEDGGAAVFITGHGSGHKDVRIAIDGSATEVKEPKTISRYRGEWKDGTFAYKVEFVRASDGAPDGTIHSIRRSFKMTPDGLIVRVTSEPARGPEAVGLYRLAKDIPLPTPAKAVIGDIAWLSGVWLGKRSSGSSIEERWSPPLGGAMLAISRTVNTSGRMNAFEYLRIVERDGGLVYVAQPGGSSPTEFTLTELTATRAVFDNPRHDYPKRVVYELSSDGVLSATTGFMKGGTPRRFEFKREGVQ